MKKLLSLPPNLVNCFHEIANKSREEWYCTNDPIGKKLGSGGGTAWLLENCYKDTGWKPSEKKILLHAGGQSRRLPAYAPSGKILTPIPVFRWERGQKLSQTLLDLQLPLYEHIMSQAPERLNTMIVSGDVLIRATKPLQQIPDVDIVCYGLWLSADIAKDHGVFVMNRETPDVLKCMLQKPSVETLSELLTDHYYLTDIGIWILSDRAVEMLCKKSTKDGEVVEYDMYSEFGTALGTNPTSADEDLKQLSVAILPLPGGEFYHYGTSHEIISSTLDVQNITNNQEEILHNSRKPHPSIFHQNSRNEFKFTSANRNIWIENSHINSKWTLTTENIITGVPENDWELDLPAGLCIDLVPIGESDIVVRTYGFNDKFAGKLQSAPLFPVCKNVADAGNVIQFTLSKIKEQINLSATSSICIDSLLPAIAEELQATHSLMSAEQISNEANLLRLNEQRKVFRKENWAAIADNYEHSVFYQIDLEDAAKEFVSFDIPTPESISDKAPLLTRIHDAMFRSQIKKNKGEDSKEEEEKAFSLLRQESLHVEKVSPKMSTYSDQIVWGRSPVRIDLAGGWTDTPPYCLMEGGAVVNIAIELNGQQPIQTYVKPCKEPIIILRSIDLGAEEHVETYEELAQYNKLQSPFSIPKSALALAGFLPQYCNEQYASLRQQLEAFGSGIEVTMLSAIPAGSGLGTSSMLAATVLGALNDFCGLHWDKNELGIRTLILEQLLTSGGGWQDQYGGILPGAKLLTTERGFNQSPKTLWLPTDIFTNPEYKPCHLLYYTGITRTAKNILGEIVRRMFLNQGDELAVLRQMKQHAHDMYEAIQCVDYSRVGKLVRKTWAQNQAIDAGTNPPQVQQITELIDDLCAGYKLPGAGGGGYLYTMAKDAEAAARIRTILQNNAPNSRARIVEMNLSNTGLAVSRS